MSAPWMPLYVADYLADTRSLTTLEHGAYMLMIMDYWRNGGLPNDDKKLARIVGLALDEWSTIRDNMAELFQDGWKHKRIDEELLRSKSRSNAAKDKASKRWQTQGNPPADAPALLEQSTGNAISQSQSHTPVANATGVNAREGRSSTFSSNAQPKAEDRQAALDAGLTEGEFREEWPVFRSWQVSHNVMSFNWTESWKIWLHKSKRFKDKDKSDGHSNSVSAGAQNGRDQRGGSVSQAARGLLSLGGERIGEIIGERPSLTGSPESGSPIGLLPAR